MEANTAMRVPSTMRAPPWCAASQADRRCAGVMPLCKLTTACGPHCGTNRASKRACSCGVRLISGTMTSTWARGSRKSTSCTARKYTSVLPLPVAPNSKNGPGWDWISANTCACSGLSMSPAAPSACAGAPGAALAILDWAFSKRWARRCNCRGDTSRSCGGKAASATSPAERW